ncbi:MAG: HAMP domain-containing histidine kinase [Muribaculaceae bacterium]|nr:HAMP domain-containing histidine kinase [Muribaculaceae bacterium]
MKKQTIWILTILMAFTFIGLLCIQIFYMKNIVGIRYEQFSQGVRQSLIAVAQHLERDETRYFLEDQVNLVESQSIYAKRLASSLPTQEGLKVSFATPTVEADLTIRGDVSALSKIQTGESLVGQHFQTMQDVYRDHYLYQRGVLDDVILNIISSASDRTITERADSSLVRTYLRQQLDTLGIDVPFEFAVVNRLGVIQYKSAGYNPGENVDDVFTQTLFPRDPASRIYRLKVYFPTKSDYIFRSISFMVPAFAFTLILLVIFIYTIIVAFRQKKLTEMKNDFINNMTHEFKTPISSISLAAQMLNDPDIRKSPAMLQQISQVVNDETKRLRFQVEKVLQMSMFDRQKATLKIEEIDANLVVYNIVNTFKLKVEKYGGHIDANLDAMNALVEVDEMHFTNVIFNLLDNAVKYRSEERPLHLVVGSRDLPGERLEISIADNGIGIRRDDLKKIFDKFFRVSTGNRHDVKGFGLGLAYVHKMVTELGGTISVESEINIGTKFIIILPLSKN